MEKKEIKGRTRKQSKKKAPDYIPQDQRSVVHWDDATMYGVKRIDGKVVPVFGQGDDGSFAVNTDAVLSILREANEGLAFALRTYQEALSNISEDGQTHPKNREIIEEITDFMETILQTYNRATNACGGIFAVLNIILGNSPDTVEPLGKDLDMHMDDNGVDFTEPDEPD